MRRAHVIAWRKDLEARVLSPSHPVEALCSILSDRYLCERNAVCGNPVDGVKRPLGTAMKIARRPW